MRQVIRHICIACSNFFMDNFEVSGWFGEVEPILPSPWHCLALLSKGIGHDFLDVPNCAKLYICRPSSLWELAKL